MTQFLDAAVGGREAAEVITGACSSQIPYLRLGKDALQYLAALIDGSFADKRLMPSKAYNQLHIEFGSSVQSSHQSDISLVFFFVFFNVCCPHISLSVHTFHLTPRYVSVFTHVLAVYCLRTGANFNQATLDQLSTSAQLKLETTEVSPLMLHPHKIQQLFFMGTHRKKKYGFGGGVLWDRSWEMKFLNILVLAIKKVVRYYGFP